MTDLEMTKLCAKAMGYTDISEIEFPNDPRRYVSAMDQKRGLLWNPLQYDAQAMALVKKFELEIGWMATGRASVNFPNEEGPNWIEADTLNRAICECVAQMQQNKDAK